MSVGIHVGAPINDNLAIWFQRFPESSAAQVFLHGPHSKKLNHIDMLDLGNVAAHKHIYDHSSYRTSFNDMDHIEDQFSAAASVGCTGVVIHIPLMDVAGVSEKAVEIVHRGHGCKLVLEMKAVKPHNMNSYESPYKINRLIEALRDKGLMPDQVGICIDTAHISAGKQQIRKLVDAEAYLDQLQYPEYICLLHLNGNEYDGQQRAGDKHILPFRKDINGDTDHRDTIWANRKYSASGCRAFVEWFQQRGKDIIVECKWDDHLEKFVRILQ